MYAQGSLAWSIILLAPSLALSVPVQAGDAKLTLELVADNLDLPVFLTHAPGDFDRLFVLEQGGLIRIIKDGTVLDRPFLDISDLTEAVQNQGLVGLAFHPEYEMNGFFYLVYTTLDGTSVVARYQVTADRDIGDPGSEQYVLSVAQQSATHNVGWIGWGPNDSYLYIGSGDGGGPLDPGDDAQDINSLLGKILRIDIDGDDFPADPQRNYAIPPDNPFVGKDGADEIWAYGLRQPWRCSFDRETGDLYIGDVGQSGWEELNFQPSTSLGGENYGWDCLEGTECTGEPTCECADSTLVHPLHVYANPRVGRSVIGGYVYRGCAIPDLVGDFLFADHSASRIWRLEHDGQRIIELEEITNELDPNGNQLKKPASFGEDLYGEIYFCARNHGRVFKIVGAANTTILDDFNAFRGFYDSGDLDDLLESDDSDLCYNPGIVLNPAEAPVTLDFFGTLPNDSPASLDVTIESSANTVGLELTFSFWNFNTNSWDVVGTDTQSLNTDTVKTFAGVPADHVEAGTGEVRTRYEVRVVSFIFVFPWLDCVDHVFWTTT